MPKIPPRKKEIRLAGFFTYETLRAGADALEPESPAVEVLPVPPDPTEVVPESKES